MDLTNEAAVNSFTKAWLQVYGLLKTSLRSLISEQMNMPMTLPARLVLSQVVWLHGKLATIPRYGAWKRLAANGLLTMVIMEMKMMLPLQNVLISYWFKGWWGYNLASQSIWQRLASINSLTPTETGTMFWNSLNGWWLYWSELAMVTPFRQTPGHNINTKHLADGQSAW